MLHHEIKSYEWILVAMVLGTMAGVPLSRVALTAVPQRTALSHAFGGLAAGLVGTAKYFLWAGTDEMTPFRMGAIIFEVILGYLTCTGSLMAAGKLQEILPTRPITYKGQNLVNLALLLLAIGIGAYLGLRPDPHVPLPGDDRAGAGLRRAAGHPDRRRRHADGHLAAQLLRRPRRRGDGLRAREQAADHRRRARRIVGPDPVDHHVQGDEPLVHQRAVRRLRPGAGGGRRRRAEGRQERDRRGRRADPRQRQHGRRDPRLRHGGGPGAAPRPRPLRAPQQEGHRREVRHPPGGGPHARAHERAARRSRDSLRPADRDGRHQPRDGAGRRRAWWSAPTTSSTRRRGTTRAARSSACRSSTPTRPRPCWPSSAR